MQQPMQDLVSSPLTFLATCPKGLEQLLETELQQLGATGTQLTVNGVRGEIDLAGGYRVCLWSRLANRMLIELGQYPAANADELYAAARQINWPTYLRPGGTLLVDFRGRSDSIQHTHFGALRIKDAIVDEFREQGLERPNIDKNFPDLRVQALLRRDRVSLYLDLGGRSLHQRGYRLSGGEAPLKENLAAAILLRADWPELARQGARLIDPMCGSGTLLIEAAWLATDSAPGLLDPVFGFQRWPSYQPDQWKALLEEARLRREQGRERLSAVIQGFDADLKAVKAAQSNLERAGLVGLVHVERRALAEFRLPPSWEQSGLLVTNPPYGERLSDEITVQPLYQAIGEVLRRYCQG